MVAGHDAKGRVLDSLLEAVNISVGGERGPDRGSVLCNRTDNGFVGAKKRFFRLTPVGTGQGFKEVDATGGLDGGEFTMGAKGHHGIKDYQHQGLSGC